jgi:ATP-dependent DNA ligase
MFHSDTLIDGEVIITENSGGEPIVTFIAFDLIVIGGVSVAQRSFSTRLGILQQDVIKPLHQSIFTHPHWHQPFKYY